MTVKKRGGNQPDGGAGFWERQSVFDFSGSSKPANDERQPHLPCPLLFLNTLRKTPQRMDYFGVLAMPVRIFCLPE